MKTIEKRRTAAELLLSGSTRPEHDPGSPGASLLRAEPTQAGTAFGLPDERVEEGDDPLKLP